MIKVLAIFGGIATTVSLSILFMYIVAVLIDVLWYKKARKKLPMYQPQLRKDFQKKVEKAKLIYTILNVLFTLTISAIVVMILINI